MDWGFRGLFAGLMPGSYLGSEVQGSYNQTITVLTIEPGQLYLRSL